MGLAYKVSIALMLGLVFGIIGTIVFIVARTIRREERERGGGGRK